VTINIAAAPTGATAYVVYCGQGGGTRYVCGGGIALAGGTTHTLKTTMTKQAMANRYFIHGSSQIQGNTIGTIENANPITYGTARTYTSSHYDSVWSPFFKDPSQIYCLQVGGGGGSTTLKADLFDIQAGTINLNQTTTADGQPAVIYNGNEQLSATAMYLRSIPELMAYACCAYPYVTSATAIPQPGRIIIRSCMTNEVLAVYGEEDIVTYAQNTGGGGSYNYGHADFEPYYTDIGSTVTPSVDLLMASRNDRAVFRRPVAWFR
jgi:hypothetical protein